MLLAHVEEEPARHAAAEDLVGDGDRGPRFVGALRPQGRDVDVALRAVGPVDDGDLEAAGRVGIGERGDWRLAASPGAKGLLGDGLGGLGRGVARDDDEGVLGHVEPLVESAAVGHGDPADLGGRGVVRGVRVVIRGEIEEIAIEHHRGGPGAAGARRVGGALDFALLELGELGDVEARLTHDGPEQAEGVGEVVACHREPELGGVERGLDREVGAERLDARDEILAREGPRAAGFEEIAGERGQARALAVGGFAAGHHHAHLDDRERLDRDGGELEAIAKLAPRHLGEAVFLCGAALGRALFLHDRGRGDRHHVADRRDHARRRRRRRRGGRAAGEEGEQGNGGRNCLAGRHHFFFALVADFLAFASFAPGFFPWCGGSADAPRGPAALGLASFSLGAAALSVG